MRFPPAALLAALLAFPAHPADPPAARDKKPSVDELVSDLGSPAFAVREKAQRDLWARGEEAVPALEKATRSDDPEVARRAQELLDKFGWGVRPDTPPAVLKLVKQFQAGDPVDAGRSAEVRRRVVTDLLKLGAPGVSAVRAILRRDIPDDARGPIAAHVTALVRREVPLLLVAGKGAEADDLVALHATGTTPDGAADFAAYHVLRGDLPAATAAVEAALARGRDKDALKRVLVYLHRAAGQWKKARDTAAALPTEPESASFEEILLEEEGNWAALADLPPGRELNHPDAVRLTLLRLAGRDEKFDAELKKVRADADELVDAEDVLSAAVALLSNNRAAAAAEVLAGRKKNLGLLSEIQIARLKYKEALDLIGGGAKEKEVVAPSERLEFDLRRARVLMTLGRKDEAVQLFEEVSGGVRAPSMDGGDTVLSRPARSLIRTEVRVGLRDLACEHGAKLVPPNVASAGSTSAGESVFELLFPHDPGAAETLFLLLRAGKVPGDQPGASMIRTRDLLGGTAGPAAVDQAAKLLRDAAAVPDAGLAKARRYLALAAVLRAAKRPADAEAAFKAAAELTAGAEGAATVQGARSWVYGAPDPARVWIEWGEYLREQGRFRDAAAAFEAGWKLFPDQPLPLFLCGQALAAAGDAKEGARRVELSHWVCLGNEKVRGRFVDELIRRGEGKAIRREVGLISKACWSHSHMFGNVMNQCARGAALVNDFAAAEVYGQRSLLVVLRKPGIYFVDTAGYLNVPNEILQFRARALLSAGKVDEAVAAAREVLSVTPGYLELVCGIVPELDKLGRKKQADELFRMSWGAFETVLKEHPGSGLARAALAQLSGQCNRELADGLRHARAAVKADAGSLAYREWLAEVHFRRGERAEAVRTMQALADENPRTYLYRRQLARYRTAAFDSPWPHTAD